MRCLRPRSRSSSPRWTKGELMVRHPHFTQPIFVRFPRPAVMRGRDGVERFPPSTDLPFEDAVVRQLVRLDPSIRPNQIKDLIVDRRPTMCGAPWQRPAARAVTIRSTCFAARWGTASPRRRLTARVRPFRRSIRFRTTPTEPGDRTHVHPPPSDYRRRRACARGLLRVRGAREADAAVPPAGRGHLPPTPWRKRPT